MRTNLAIAVSLLAVVIAVVGVGLGIFRPWLSCGIVGDVWLVMSFVVDSSWLRRSQRQLVEDHIAGKRQNAIARTLSFGGVILNMLWLFN